MPWEIPKTDWVAANTGADLPNELNILEFNTRFVYLSSRTYQLSGSTPRLGSEATPYTVYKGMVEIPPGYRFKIQRLRANIRCFAAETASYTWRLTGTSGAESSAESFTPGAFVDLGPSWFASTDPTVYDNTGDFDKRVTLVLDHAAYVADRYHSTAFELTAQIYPIP